MRLRWLLFWLLVLGFPSHQSTQVNMAEREPHPLSEWPNLSYLMAGPSRPLMGCRAPPPPPGPLGPQSLSATEPSLEPLIPPPLEQPLEPETPSPAEGLPS
ncbi:hypothetical protein AAY473_035381 [Plecturocebus cupreus]